MCNDPADFPDLIDGILQDITALPDRSHLLGKPDTIVVTHDELRNALIKWLTTKSQ